MLEDVEQATARVAPKRPGKTRGQVRKMLLCPAQDTKNFARIALARRIRASSVTIPVHVMRGG